MEAVKTEAVKTNEPRLSPLKEKLEFAYLPSYARFLLDNELDNFSTESLRLARAHDFPILKYLDLMPEAQLLELAKKNNTLFLTYAAENELDKYIQTSPSRWSKDQLPADLNTQIIAEDIAAYSYLMKLVLLTFLPKYAQDNELTLALVSEIDKYFFKRESVAFSGLVKKTEDELQQYSSRLEQKNVELESINKELESFGYIASHDLQEPLRNIKIFSNLILEAETANLSEKGRQLFKRISSASARMQKLIDDLLAFSHVQTSADQLVDIDLNPIMHEIENAHADAIAEKTLIIHSTALPQVKGVAFQFRQLFENIISNAVKYAKAGVTPEVTMTCETIKGEAILNAGAEPKKAYYRIAVADNGIGFEQKYAAKIFQVFQRLHGKDEYSGTGIGLAICKKIMQHHNGYIYAESEPGHGSVFFICLPCP